MAFCLRAKCKLLLHVQTVGHLDGDTTALTKVCATHWDGETSMLPLPGPSDLQRVVDSSLSLCGDGDFISDYSMMPLLSWDKIPVCLIFY